MSYITFLFTDSIPEHACVCMVSLFHSVSHIRTPDTQTHKSISVNILHLDHILMHTNSSRINSKANNRIDSDLLKQFKENLKLDLD